MRKAITLLTATCALAGASVAQAKPVHYSGKTRDGDPISFTVKKGKISHLKAYVPTTCGGTDGGTRTGTSAFDPSGTFRIGHKKMVKGTRENELGVTSDITKYFKVSSHRHKHGRISGSLNSSFSFLQVLYTYPISSEAFVCRGDTKFNLRPSS
jgi:hypothetical protein